MFTTPILFIIFNRPEATQRVLKRIREIKPKYLFVAADGPRPGKEADAELCLKTRQMVTQLVDWECEVKTLYRDINLGCGRGVSEAISWFFDQVDKGIILEDDCLPSLSFFPYCEFLLNLYESDSRIMMVSGFNPLGKWQSENVDYFFTEGSIWGWASWRRAWKKYDYGMKQFSGWRANNYFRNVVNRAFLPSFDSVYDKIVEGELNTWDYQWYFARLINNGLSTTPSVNLIENIGFDEQATHTKWSLNPLNGMKGLELEFPLRVNPVMTRDEHFIRSVFEKEQKEPTYLTKIKNRLRKMIK